jgi:hypothetical protein
MRAVVLAALSLVLAGCSKPWLPPTRHAAPTPVRTAQQGRDYKRLRADVSAIKRAAAKVHHRTLMGTPELQRTTGAFLDRLDRSSLDPKMKNRMIDFAAAAVAGSCDQCFQMLEAARPIPQIAGH